MNRLYKLSISTLLACSSLFAVDEAGLSKAMQDFDQKNYAASFEQLSKLNEKDSADTKVNYFLGRSAFELGKFEVAISAYERVLMIDSAHTRSRLELARCYAALGMFKDAKMELKNALNDNPPADVKENINSALAQIDSKERKHLFEGSVSLGYGYDSNANSNPDESKIAGFLSDVYGIKGGNVTSQKKGASYSSESASLKHFYLMGNDESAAWDSSLFAYNQNYTNNGGAFDILYFSASTGPSFSNGRWSYGLPLSVDKFVYGHKNFLRSASLAPRIGYALSDTLLLNGYIKYQLKYYDDAADKDKNSKVAEIGGLVVKTLGAHVFSAGVSAFTEKKKSGGSQAEFVDRSQCSIKGGYSTTALSFVDFSAQVGYKKTFYDDANGTGMSSKRDDDTKSFELAFSKKLSKSAQLSLSYNYTAVRSNFTPASYDRRLYLLSLDANF